MAKGVKKTTENQSTNDAQPGNDFVNPFDKGVTYAQFIEAKGDLSVQDYCNGILTDEQIQWLEIELEHFTTK